VDTDEGSGEAAARHHSTQNKKGAFNDASQTEKAPTLVSKQGHPSYDGREPMPSTSLLQGGQGDVFVKLTKIEKDTAGGISTLDACF
jgi:hypothetical protein